MTQYSNNKNPFSLIHLNIRSIPKNLSQFTSYSNNIHHKFTVIGFTETWLTKYNSTAYNIEDYQHYSLTREHKRGGGVSLFVSSSFNAVLRTDLNILNNNIEALFIELSKKETNLSKDNIIGIIYRPPASSMDDFYEKLSDILCKIKVEDKLLHLMGDFNINILECDNNRPTANFIDLMYSNSLFPLITKPTRVAQNSISLIDNIYCNDIEALEKLNGILFTDISDHFPVFSVNYNNTTKNFEHVYKSRIYSTKNINIFKNRLQVCDWNYIIENTDGKKAFTDFYQKFCTLYDESFPLKTFKSKYQNKHKWLTEGLKKSITIKNKLYIRYKKCSNDENLNNYKSYKRQLAKLMKVAERGYFNNLISENKNNLRKVWSVIKVVINKNKTTKLPSQFKLGDKIINDKAVIADKFNSFFTNVGNDLSKKYLKQMLAP